ncbi:Fic family protein [Candidatus Uhrbacteria bacterium]|nr:Fic family protein [Candidatus Uhrbacteria bacterium]
MEKIPRKYQEAINIFLRNELMRSSDVHRELSKSGQDMSLVTVKRMVSDMVEAGLLQAIGAGRSRQYAITSRARLFSEIGGHDYMALDPDERYGLSGYNFDLFHSMPSDIFLDEELHRLEAASVEYRKRTIGLPQTLQKKELERLIVELSWKSSKIEGNTYSLLDTEKLLLENKEAPGHSKQEARMILNHKDTFLFAWNNVMHFKTLTRTNLEELHSILVKDLDVDAGVRTHAVGITGSRYRPLDNAHQINDAVESLAKAVSHMQTPYGKALVALLGISYIQPFHDGNKRTGRIMANALLLANSCAPLSYRSVDEDEYREATLVFYELNSLMPMKKIFISQYEFASHNYAVKKNP